MTMKSRAQKWQSLIDVATMDAAIAETSTHGHALMRDSQGCYLLMVPIDDENVNIIPLHTYDRRKLAPPPMKS